MTRPVTQNSAVRRPAAPGLAASASRSLARVFALGSGVVIWYDRKGLYRLQPDLLAFVSKSVEMYKTRDPGPRGLPPDAPKPPDGAATSGRPPQQRDSPTADRDPGEPDGGADEPPSHQS